MFYHLIAASICSLRRLLTLTSCFNRNPDSMYFEKVYCPFCGILLRPDPHNGPDYLMKSAFHWDAEVRGLYRSETNSIALTGLGIVAFGVLLYAPHDSEKSYVGLELEDMEEWQLVDSSDDPPMGQYPMGQYGFGFHNSCWKLLLLRIGSGTNDGAPNETEIARLVFNLLQVTPFTDRSVFQFGHDYGGAAKTHNLSGLSVLRHQDSHFYADPCVIPPTENLEALALDFLETGEEWLRKWRLVAGSTNILAGESVHGSNGNGSASGVWELDSRESLTPSATRETNDQLAMLGPSILDALPHELIFEIFSYLSFEQFLNLRLVCRGLARFATLNMLSQSYWRSRFLLHREFDFLFLDVMDNQDWNLLFFGIRASLKMKDRSLINRKRIRQLLEPIAALVNLDDFLRNGPCGSIFHEHEDHYNYYWLGDSDGAKDSSRLVKMTKRFEGRRYGLGEEPHLRGKGCLLLYDRAQSLVSPRQQCQGQIGISTIQLGAQSYISGIALSRPGKSDIDCLVGYRNPFSEKWIEIPDTCQLESLSVAFSAQGLTGIEIISTDSRSLGCVGVLNGPGVGRGTLPIPERSNESFLLAGLDHFKIVSLGIGELADDPGVPVTWEVPSLDVINSNYVRSALWTPVVPNFDGLGFSFLLPQGLDRDFMPLTNVDFGGVRGTLLASLTRLTFYLDSTPCMFTGVEIYYSDGRSMLFGSNKCCAISFFINGPQGERITQVGIVHNDPDPTLFGGLQISTNWKRTATFASLKYRHDAILEPIPIGPPTNTITGLFARELEMTKEFMSPALAARRARTNLTCFERVGIQSQHCGEQPRIPDDMNHERHQIPEKELNFDLRAAYIIKSAELESYQTYASLKNIRRIQASIGIEGQSRSPSRISGLRFDYYDHASPGVVGQWMQELDEGFELSPGEQIQSLVIWRIPVGYSSDCPGLKLSQVVRIHIGTSFSRNVTFCSPEFHALQNQGLLCSRYRQVSECLTAISWILNGTCEYVRAVNFSEETPKSHSLVPGLWAPSDKTRNLYFERPTDDGCRDPIVRAEAYFRGKVIVGIVFVYSSGETASMGELHTGIYRGINFGEDYRIHFLSAVITPLGLLELEFESMEADSYHLSLSTEPYEHKTPEDGAKSIWALDTSEWWELSYELGYDWDKWDDWEEGDYLHQVPEKSTLAGIYTDCGDFKNIGAVYKPGTWAQGMSRK